MTAASRPAGRIQSLARMDAILDVIAHAPEGGVRLTDVATRCGLHKNTVFSLLKTLVALGYCDHARDTQTYRIGRRTFELARNAERNLDIVTLVRPLMLRLVWHSLADYFHDQQKYVHFLVFEERDVPVQASPMGQLFAEDILRMVDTLPPASAEVFRLYAIEGFSHAEIGEQLGISDGTSKWHLSTARQQLKKLINQHELKIYAG